MLKISNVKVYDLEESVIACRNAMRTSLPEYTKEEFERSLKRAIKLANTPNCSGHQTFLSGIRVSFDIVYPNYISPELQRYHWLDIVTSSSKMHKLMEMNLDMCFTKYVTEESKALMRKYVAQYKENPTYENFMIALNNCPQGIELFMRCSSNFLQLKSIYHQRKHHKLVEDWQEGFCRDFIEKLPYAKEFIIGDKDKENV